MNEKHARITANLVMTAAALGAAVIVFRSPKLRRLAWQFARQYATGPLAAWTVGTVMGAWEESGRERPPSLDRFTERATAGQAID